ncbi:MAG: CaiB/BaiF CoA transferase family protein [Burkholderiaceae bacterium]
MTESLEALPYEGLRVVEFAHMVMGPSCGLVLADLGAEVIKVEPPSGDSTRGLLGSGAGFFPLFNRNKKSIILNLQTPEGREAALKLIDTADVVLENFRPGTMQRLGLDYVTLKNRNPRLVYASLKGFLPGPYENRTALDEVVQMMGGLAYMTGRPNDPLRAGASVNDIMGGMFGAIGIMAALAQRQHTGMGQLVQSALFENNVFLVAQHIMQYAATGVPASPMPERVSAWGIYDVFEVNQGEQIFLAVVSDTQWVTFCRALGFDDLLLDGRLSSNNQRVEARAWLIPVIRERIKGFSKQALSAIFERQGLPFAPITAPHDLLDDPHLHSAGGFVPVRLTDGPKAGRLAQAALLPLALSEHRLGLRLQPPRAGEHSYELLSELGYSGEQIERLTGSPLPTE